MEILAVYNIKGGVGKTAAAVNLAYLSALESRTLLIDLDPQGASSFYLGIAPELDEKARKVMMGDEPLIDSIKRTRYRNLHVLPADKGYRKIDKWLYEHDKPARWFSALLKPLKREYQNIIIDCPPNITISAESVLAAADHVIVPVVPTVLSLRTYEQLLEFFRARDLDEKKLFPFFSMVERRKNMHIESMRQFLSEKGSLDIAIPYSADVEKMGVYQAPLVHELPHSEVAMEFRKLWKAISARLED